VLILFPLIALLVIGILYRDDLSMRAIIIYAAIWAAGLAAVFVLDLSPGYFIVLECLLAITMLIHVRANPQL
jgi:hypothetical protein